MVACRYVRPATPPQTSSRNYAMAFALLDPATVKAIRLADAVAAIRAHLCPILDTELVDLAEARGRILAEGLIGVPCGWHMCSYSRRHHRQDASAGTGRRRPRVKGDRCGEGPARTGRCSCWGPRL